MMRTSLAAVLVVSASRGVELLLLLLVVVRGHTIQGRRKPCRLLLLLPKGHGQGAVLLGKVEEFGIPRVGSTGRGGTRSCCIPPTGRSEEEETLGGSESSTHGVDASAAASAAIRRSIGGGRQGDDDGFQALNLSVLFTELVENASTPTPRGQGCPGLTVYKGAAG